MTLSAPTTYNYNRGAQLITLGGLALAALLVAGCGPSSPAPAPVKPAQSAAATPAAPAADQTNNPEEYTSVFENQPKFGKDPFYPNSHRRDPVAPIATEMDARVDPVLELKAVLKTRSHSQAVINNEILEKGEIESIRVPSGHVRVRCIEIGNDYVVVQVEGESELKRLVMDQKKR